LKKRYLLILLASVFVLGACGNVEDKEKTPVKEEKKAATVKKTNDVPAATPNEDKQDNNEVNELFAHLNSYEGEWFAHDAQSGQLLQMNVTRVPEWEAAHYYLKIKNDSGILNNIEVALQPNGAGVTDKTTDGNNYYVYFQIEVEGDNPSIVLKKQNDETGITFLRAEASE